MSLIVVSIISFFDFFNLKGFLASLIMFSSSRLGPLYVVKKINHFRKLYLKIQFNSGNFNQY